ALLQHGERARGELPGLGDLGSPLDRGEDVAPSSARGLDDEGELPAPVGHDDVRTCLPGSFGELVAAGEAGADARTVALVPPAGLAHRAPIAHAGHVSDHVVEVVG